MKLKIETVHGVVVHEQEVEGASLLPKGMEDGKLSDKEQAGPNSKNREG